jgi:hypothetical protein
MFVLRDCRVMFVLRDCLAMFGAASWRPANASSQVHTSRVNIQEVRR